LSIEFDKSPSVDSFLNYLYKACWNIVKGVLKWMPEYLRENARLLWGEKFLIFGTHHKRKESKFLQQVPPNISM
jgi:hypothetical protein